MATANGPAIRFGVGITDLTKLSRDLRGVEKSLSAGFTKALKVAAQPVADEAKINAGFSERIPGTIKVTSTGGKAKVRVRVTAGGKRAPEAAAFEHQGTPGTFRHPVFNRNVWVNQAAHPFLFPALVSKAESVADDIGTAIDGYLKANGL